MRVLFIGVSLLLAMIIQFGIHTPPVSGQTAPPGRPYVIPKPPAPPDQAEKRKILEARKKYNAARRLESRGDYELALGLYQELLRDFPENRSYFNGYRNNLIALEKYEDLISLFKERIEKNYQNESLPSLYAGLGEAYYLAGEPAMAEFSWKQALEIIPGSIDAYRELSYTFIRLRLTERAISILEQGRKDNGDPYLFSTSLANLHQSMMNWQGAAHENLLSLRESKRRMKSVLRNLANFPNTETAETAVAKAVDKELKATRQSEPWEGYRAVLYEIRAGQFVKKGDLASAFTWVDKIDRESATPGIRLVEFAVTARNEGADSVAQHALQVAATRLTDPKHRASVDFALAGLAVAEGRYPEADSLLSIHCAGNPRDEITREALLQRGLLHLHQVNDPTGAIADFERLLKYKNPKANAIRKAYAEALILTDRLDEAIQQLGLIKPPRFSNRPPGMYSSYIESDTTLLETVELRARILWWQHRTKEAIALLDSTLMLTTGADKENDLLEFSMLMRKTADDSLLADQFIKVDNLLFLRKKDKAAMILGELGEDTSSWAGQEALWRLAMLYEGESPEKETEILSQFVERFPTYPRCEEAWLTLGDLAEARGDTVSAITAYENLLVEFPEGMLTSEARLRLDRLSGIELPPLLSQPELTP